MVSCCKKIALSICEEKDGLFYGTWGIVIDGTKDIGGTVLNDIIDIGTATINGIVDVRNRVFN